jgi:hypothetical protein
VVPAPLGRSAERRLRVAGMVTWAPGVAGFRTLAACVEPGKAAPGWIRYLEEASHRGQLHVGEGRDEVRAVLHALLTDDGQQTP